MPGISSQYLESDKFGSNGKTLARPVALLARDENKYSSFVLHMFSKLSIYHVFYLISEWKVEQLSHSLIDTGRS